MSAEKVITERCDYLRTILEGRGFKADDVEICLDHIKNAVLEGYHQGQVDYSTGVLPEILRMATTGKF